MFPLLAIIAENVRQSNCVARRTSVFSECAVNQTWQGSNLYKILCVWCIDAESVYNDLYENICKTVQRKENVSMNFVSKTRAAAILGIALTLLPTLRAHAGNPVVTGGTYSTTGAGYHDMAVAANTTIYRAKGGGLYIHPNGWDPTASADQSTVHSLFPNPPVYESALGGNNSQPFQFYSTRLAKYWPQLDAVLLNFAVDVPTDAIQQVKTSFNGVCDVVGPICGPNANATDATNYPWNSTRWDQLRANALAGGAISTDAPPSYYFARDENYRIWIAACIAWANANGVRTYALLYPRDSPDFPTDMKRYVLDLEARGARPAVWSFDGYYSSGSTVYHPMGSETNPNDQDYSARVLAQREAGTPIIGAKNSLGASGTAALDGNPNTYVSTNGVGQYLQLNLGAIYNVNGISLQFRNGSTRTQSFSVSVSPDNVHWTSVFSGHDAGNTTAMQDYVYANTPARYIRIVNGGNTLNTSMAVSEVKTLGWPLPPTLAATSNNTSLGSPAKAIDNNLNTSFTVPNLGDSLTLDLGSPMNTEGVSVAFPSGTTRTQRFHADVSSDGSTWTTALSNAVSSGKTLQKQDFLWSGVRSVRYVRVVNDGNSVNARMGITEVSVIGY